MLVVLSVLSCTEADRQRACREVACLEFYATIHINVVDEAGDPVELDRVKVSRIADGFDMTSDYENGSWEDARKAGMYILADDGDAGRLTRFEDTRLRFQGYIDNQEVVSGDYVVTYDCCHISLVSGEEKLVVK